MVIGDTSEFTSKNNTFTERNVFKWLDLSGAGMVAKNTFQIVITSYVVDFSRFGFSCLYEAILGPDELPVFPKFARFVKKDSIFPRESLVDVHLLGHMMRESQSVGSGATTYLHALEQLLADGAPSQPHDDGPRPVLAG